MMQVDGDYEFLQEIIDDFLGDFAERKSNLEGQIKKCGSELKAITDLRKDSHAVKGSALNLGLGRVSALAKKLEGAAKECETEKKTADADTQKLIKTLGESLFNEVERVKKEHASILRKHEEENG